MNLFDNYSASIQQIISSQANPQTRDFSKLHESNINTISKAVRNENDLTLAPVKNQKHLVQFDKEALANLFGCNPHAFPEPTIGDHPDFCDLQENELTYHYCTSFFLDIKGSTKLSTKYNLEVVRLVKDTLLSLSINVVNFFGGHIQRLQGDALFAQFVRRKEQHINDSVIGAINTASILCHYVNNVLAEIFEEMEVDPLKVRIGIDVGDNEKVLWSRYGLALCGELTTTSLHTDLAAKLQAQAANNGILIGGNVKELLDLEFKEKNGFIEYLINDEGEKDRYIFNYNGIRYNKFLFNWDTYLLRLPFIKRGSDGISLVAYTPELTLKCFISSPGTENWVEYYPNSYSIPKEYKIKFEIVYSNGKKYLSYHEKVEWKAFNGGCEAEQQTPSQRQHDFEGEFKGRECTSSAAFLGHHYVQCKIIQKADKGRQAIQKAKITFPIFVQ